MKIVMSYTSGDGYTYSCEILKIFEYESEEALLCDFMDLVRAHWKAAEEHHTLHNRAMAALKRGERVAMVERPPATFKFCGEEWSWGDFVFYNDQRKMEELPPTVETFDAYFERCGLKK